jgi:hypothetical protein
MKAQGVGYPSGDLGKIGLSPSVWQKIANKKIKKVSSKKREGWLAMNFKTWTIVGSASPSWSARH